MPFEVTERVLAGRAVNGHDAAMVSMSKGQADAANAALARARQSVLAVIAGSGGSADVPAFQSAGTGRPVPTPMQQRLPFIVAAVDLVLLVIAVAIGNYVLA